MNLKNITILIIVITISCFLCNNAFAEDLPFMDYTNMYPQEQAYLHYILYIDDEPFKDPYLGLEFAANNKEIVYYVPARPFLDMLGISGTYDKASNKLLINGMEFPAERAVLGRDLKTDEKILYLPMKEVLEFLNLPIRIQETTLGVTLHVRTDSLKTPSADTNANNSDEKSIRWYNSIKEGQAVAQSQGKNILVKFGAVW